MFALPLNISLLDRVESTVAVFNNSSVAAKAFYLGCDKANGMLQRQTCLETT